MRPLTRVRVTGRGDAYDGAVGLTTGSVDSLGRLCVRLDARPAPVRTSAARGNVYWFVPEHLREVEEKEEGA